MRIWSLHPQYLDPQGIVALWRETLLAQAVMRGLTKGYQNHPQLIRFREQESPLSSVAIYLQDVHQEATRRGYTFDASKVGEIVTTPAPMWVTSGQMAYEWQHLLAKLKARSPALYEKYHSLTEPEAHPLFKVRAGVVESWERL